MTPPVIPQPVTPPNPQPNPSGSTPPVVNPPPTNTATELRAELDRLGRGTISELHNRLAEANAKIAALENSRATPPARPTGAEFLNDPVPIIQAELQSTVKPLKDFVEQFTAERAYESAKKQLKQTYPALGAKISELEPYIDQLMVGIKPTPENIQAAFTHALGLQQIGQIPAATPTPSTIPVTTPPSAPSTPGAIMTPPIPVPPSMPPSPPTLPNNAPASMADAALKAKVDALTEDERKIARIWGQTPEEFVQLREASDDVASWPRAK